MSELEKILFAILPGFAELLKSALSDTYDQQAELQSLLKIQRSLADARAAKQFPNG